MTQHTPGPWHYSGVSSLPRVRLGPDKDKTLGLLIADCQNCYLPEGQANANARLIAAAPDLLEMAEALREDIISTMKRTDDEGLKVGLSAWLALLTARIAKATQ